MPLTPKDSGGKSYPVFPVKIEHSALFDGASDCLSFTPTVAGNRRTWTYRCCTKTVRDPFYFLNVNSQLQFYLNSARHLALVTTIPSTANVLVTSDVFIDPSAHYDIVLAVDTTQAVASDRVKLYVNGQPITDFSTANYPALNQKWAVNSTVAHEIGGTLSGSQYISDFYLIDGQALPASTFGEFSDQMTGLWVPKGEVTIPEASRVLPADVFTGGTPSASSTWADSSANYAFNGSNAQPWISAVVGFAYLQYQLPAPKTIVEYDITARGSGYAATQAPRDWTLEGSDDEFNWTVVDDRSGYSSWGDNQLRTFTVDAPGSYAYYRLNITESANPGDYRSIAEFTGRERITFTYGANGCHIDFADANNLGKDIAHPPVRQDSAWTRGGTAASNGNYSGTYPPSKAFDGTVDSTNSGWVGKQSGGPWWLRYDYGAPVTVDKLTIWHWTQQTNRNARDFKFQGSNDASAWEDLLTVSNGNTASSSVTHTFANSTAYRYYRLYVTATKGTSWPVGIEELQLYVAQPDDSPNSWAVHGSPIQTVDTPTNNGCTWNTLFPGANLSNGNLSKTTERATSTFPIPQTGRWAWKIPSVAAGGALGFRFVDGAFPSSGTYFLSMSAGVSYEFFYDAATGEFKYKADEGPLTSIDTLTLNKDSTLYCDANCTAEFVGFIPSETGFRTLSAPNLPDPAILKSSTVADVVLREGVGDGADVTALASSYVSTTADTTSGYPGYQIKDYAFDNNSGSAWAGEDYAGSRAASNGLCWIGCRFATPTKIQKFTIEQGLPGSSNNHYSNAFVSLDYSDDNFSTYTRLGPFAITDTPGTVDEVLTGYDGAHLDWRWHQGGSGTGSIGGLWGVRNINAYAELSTDITLPDMEGGPDWVNMKSDASAYGWFLFDSVRGAGKHISTNTAGAEETDATKLSAFNSNGYSLGSADLTNLFGSSFIDLALKAGAKQGFETVTFTGNGLAGRQIAHNLGKAPTFMIVKCISHDGYWWSVYHKDTVTPGWPVPERHVLYLNGTNAAGYTTATWNSTVPNATHFFVGADNTVNESGRTYVAYLFTDSDIFKAFSYTGNGSVDGPFVNLGGRPLAIPFFKNTAVTSNWYNYDSARNPHNPIDASTYPNLPNAEGVNGFCNFTSVGLKVTTPHTQWNASGSLHVGLAILESNKYSNAY